MLGADARVVAAVVVGRMTQLVTRQRAAARVILREARVAVRHLSENTTILLKQANVCTRCSKFSNSFRDDAPLPTLYVFFH